MATSVRLPVCRCSQSSGVELREQVDGITVRIEHGGIPLTPRRIEGSDVAAMPGGDDRRVPFVDFGRRRTQERQTHARPTRRRLPGGEGLDDVDRVQQEPETTGEVHLHVSLVVGIGRNRQAEQPVEVEAPPHVSHDDAQRVESEVHVQILSSDPTIP